MGYWNRDIKRTFQCNPPKHQQDRIVSFLDKKTMLISYDHSRIPKIYLNIKEENNHIMIKETVTKG